MLATCLAPAAFAQLDRRWVEFRNESATRLVGDRALLHDDPEEKDFAWGDLDNDGDVDVVIVRKQPATTAGRRPNVLLVNEGGVLVDRTALLASDADVAGDLGFLTPTNDRDVVLADFDKDGWLDVATAVTISDGLPKHVSHPRIYMNKGEALGVWQGLRFEEKRSPQLYVLRADGTPDLDKPNPGRFCSIAAGDVDMDGDVDLYLGDYDSSGGGGAGEPQGIDLNDRLWLNDGHGFFSDSYRTRLSETMLRSAFSVSVSIADMNGDGLNDVVKDTALTAPQYVGIAYNMPPNDGVFDLFHTPHALSPYFVSIDDLNNDGRLDMVVTDDNRDRYRLNLGNDALGRAQWSTALQVGYPAEALYADDGFGGQSVVADLDNDGFKDVVITDMDVDGPGCGRRAHVYRNLGNPPNVSLREEAELAAPIEGWKGAVGLSYNDLSGSFNVAAFDVDSDGDQDLLLGRCAGTSLWINTSCRLEGFGAPSENSTGKAARLEWSGVASHARDDLTLRVRNLPAGAPGEFVFAQFRLDACVPEGDGQRCIAGPEARRRAYPVTASAAGEAALRVDFTDSDFSELAPGTTRYVQFQYKDAAGGPAGYNLSNALEVRACR